MGESDQIVGRCPLCQVDGQILRKSHFMPAALYPTKKQLPRSRFGTSDEVYTGRHQEVKEPLLCGECEGRFSTNGESDVLWWLSAKAKVFRLRDQIDAIKPLEEHPELSRYRASDLGIDSSKFAYFAVSIVWRAAVHRWRLPNGHLSTQLDLGDHAERIRQYLKGDEPFPKDILAVVMIVSSDQEGREVWGLPAQFREAGCENFRLVVRGITFRLALGRTIYPIVRGGCCVATGTVFYGNVAHKIKKDFPRMFDEPVAS
jgi:hypothetical protein